MGIQRIEQLIETNQSLLEVKIHEKISELEKKIENYSLEVKAEFSRVSDLFSEKSKEWEVIQSKFGEYENQERAFQSEIAVLKEDLTKLQDVDTSNKESQKLASLIEQNFNEYKLLLEPIYNCLAAIRLRTGSTNPRAVLQQRWGEGSSSGRVPHPQTVFRSPGAQSFPITIPVPSSGVKIAEGASFQVPVSSGAVDPSGKGKAIAESQPSKAELESKMRQEASLMRQLRIEKMNSNTLARDFDMPTLKFIAFDSEQTDNMIPRRYFDIQFGDDTVLDLPMFPKAYTWNIFSLKMDDQPEIYRDLMIEFYYVNGKRQESVWRRNIIKSVNILIEPYLFKDIIQNFSVSRTRGLKGQSQVVTVADFPQMNPYDIFSIYNLSDHDKFVSTIKFKNIVVLFLKNYIKVFAEKDIHLRKMFRFDSLKPNTSISEIDFKMVTGKQDGLILNKPNWGILYFIQNNNGRRFKRFLNMADKQMFNNHFLKNMVARIEINDSNSQSDKKEAINHLVWYMEVRRFICQSVPMLYPVDKFDKYEE